MRLYYAIMLSVKDMCNAKGVCTGTALKDECKGKPACKAKGQCYLKGICNKGNGKCSNPFKPAKTKCDDKNKNTGPCVFVY